MTTDTYQKAVRIDALFGTKQFEIKEMRQMTPYQMASVVDQEGNSYIFDLDTVLKLKQQSGRLRDIAGGRIDLEPGDIVAITYNPVTKRIIEAQDSILLLHEDYESADHDAWKQKAYDYDNVMTAPVDENIRLRGLVPDDMSRTGKVMYKITSQNDAFNELGLSYKTRVIVAEANYLKIYAGTSPDQMTLMAELRPEIGAFNESRGLDLTPIAKGEKEVYVKFEMRTERFNSWTYLGEVTFRESYSQQ